MIDLSEHRAPDAVDWTGRAKPIPLAEAISMVDAWAPDFAPFTMHQMCRALREGIEESEQRYADLAERWGEANAQRGEEDAARLGNLRREDAETVSQLRDLEQAYLVVQAHRDELKTENESLRFRAAQSGVALVDGPDSYGSRVEGYPLSRVLDLMDAWRPGVERWGLHQMCRVLRAEYEAAVAELFNLVTRNGATVLAYDAAEQRALAAVPCTAGIEDCHAPHYRHQACCNLRVALWPGEEFPTDYLPDSGEVHLFAPGRGDKPRVSAGCVKLIEPTDDDSFICVPVTEEAYAAERAKVDALMDAVFGPLTVEPTEADGIEAEFDTTAILLRRRKTVEPGLYERNETLDWDRK